MRGLQHNTSETNPHIGHKNVYFSGCNAYEFESNEFDMAKQFAVEQLLKGWTVKIEQNTQTKNYIVYYGA